MAGGHRGSFLWGYRPISHRVLGMQVQWNERYNRRDRGPNAMVAFLLAGSNGESAFVRDRAVGR